MSRQRVHIEQDWYSENVRIWVFSEASDPYVLRLKDGAFNEWEKLEEGTAHPEPTLTLRADYWEAIVTAAAKTLPVTDTALEALKDTRQVRDRLLTLIEKERP